MATKENILLWLDRAIAIMANFVGLIPGKADDLALSCLRWLRDDEIFLGFLDNFEAPADNAVTMPPQAVVEGIRRWKEATGQQLTAGGYMELLGYIMQIIKWISDRKATPAPTT